MGRQSIMLGKVTMAISLSLQLEDPGEGRASGAHMISTARVPADKPVRIAFSLNDAPGTICSRGEGPPNTSRIFTIFHDSMENV